MPKPKRFRKGSYQRPQPQRGNLTTSQAKKAVELALEESPVTCTMPTVEEIKSAITSWKNWGSKKYIPTAHDWAWWCICERETIQSDDPRVDKVGAHPHFVSYLKSIGLPVRENS